MERKLGGRKEKERERRGWGEENRREEKRQRKRAKLTFFPYTIKVQKNPKYPGESLICYYLTEDTHKEIL